METQLMNLKKSMDRTVLEPGKMSAADKARLFNTSINGKSHTRRNYFAPMASLIFIMSFSFVFGHFILQNLMDRSAENSPSSLLGNEEIKNLKIGVVGKPPKVNEKKVKFEEITLTEMAKMDLSSEYDGVFIMEDFLRDAAKPEYAIIYRNSGIPIFFIQTKSTFLPFVNEDIDYEDFLEEDTPEYATGYYQNGETAQTWEYGLYNDKLSEKNIKDVYSRIFKTIDSLEENKDH
ncbi:hypothetical protein [Bacillus sp. B-jedd]|uniref:hypothetical protein n=1 Tax=Bacillus sp. B-jedd TaxID=1476857 RepID=UPI000515705B|nr:hypothetical protein [Bacillus sp. B-jedd]CEG27186.1 lipoprotein [Bacillus sp. B-jedd]